ncbi:hypothetical protein HUJ04_012225 [Dendroctonus ponderosae]|nr:hypothetical protein HUJ04_012225 [Dendroctonus ponderosae]KAH1029376.1 hypothetical protein HUJ05_002632 [Dendroctonus ponderosae]KAH1029377.1 hypothetical protein HUJ05_002632 [Dendroctonus ponderosae]
MGLQRNLVLVVSCAFLLSVCAAEFVPVYIWGTRSAGEPVPALHKISQSSFKDEVANKLRANSRIIVFAEHSLSPEDFGQRDRSGDLAFPNLSKLRKTSKVTYLSYVQNPVKAIQLASDDVAEISIERLRENFEIPDSKIVIIDLNDADENERRFDMLKRHGMFIDYFDFHATSAAAILLHSKSITSEFHITCSGQKIKFPNQILLMYFV